MGMSTPDTAALPPQLVRLSALVVKTGVGLGQMSDADRRLALSLPAWRLPVGENVDEAHVNELLKSSLQSEAAFLRTDHVELRRWLVDTGWWMRDGFGRAYARPTLEALPDNLRGIARALATVEPAAWALQQIGIYRAAQRERRARWSEAAEGPDSSSAPLTPSSDRGESSSDPPRSGE